MNMKQKIFSLLVLLVVAVTGAWADEVTIGDNTTTTTTYVTPTNSLWNYSFVEQIYTASEIGTSGTITSISFHQSSENGGNPSAVAIYMKHVNKETFGSTDDYETVSASDKVWEGTLTYLDGGGWITFTLDTPFEYNGTDNLLIACHETTSGYSTRYFYFTGKDNSAISFHSDNTIPDPYNLGLFTGSKYVSSNRANIKINIGSAAATYALEVEDSEHGSGTVKFYIDNEEVTGAKAADEGKTVTMTVTPDAGWVVDKDNITAAQLFTNWDVAGARRTAAPDVEIKDSIDVTYVSTDETTGTATFTFTMPAASVRAKAAYLKLSTLTLSPADKTNLFTVQVNGQAATPDQDGKLTDIVEGTPVKLTANTGYKFRYISKQAYGICYYNTGESWPKGFITFNFDDPSNASVLNDAVSKYHGLDFCPADQYYYAVDPSTYLVKMDLNGNVVDRVAQLSVMLGDGAWNATNNTMYAIKLKNLYTVNLRTGELNTFVTSENLNFLTIACNADGQLYTVMGDGNLYTVNATTGELTLVGATGYSPWYAESMQFEPKTGNLYWCCSDTDYDNLLQIDPTTGAATMLQARTGETTGLCFPVQLLHELAFDMPANDSIVNYELVRDMSVQVGVKVGDAEEGADYRIRVRKDGDAWRLTDLTLDELLALITVRDTLESKDLAFYGDEAVCTLNLYALDDNDQPAEQPTAFADLAPGRYVAVATAKAGSDYVSETGISNVIELYYGYEVTIPAGEFITYYKDENLTLDEEDADAKIYTITDVSETTATATELTVAAANTPILVQNTSTEEKTFVLFPTENAGDDVTAYAGFVGTLTEAQVPASTDAKTVFALNGKQFVYVKNALTIGANKAWLEVDNAAARKLTIVFDGNGTTGIADNKRESITNTRYYDLNGRKLNAAPTQKGVYILNGKKVIVR